MSETRPRAMSVSQDDSSSKEHASNLPSLSLAGSSSDSATDYHSILFTFPISKNPNHLKSISLPFRTSGKSGEWLVAGKFILLCLETIHARSISRKFHHLHIEHLKPIHFEPKDEKGRKGQAISPLAVKGAFTLINSYINNPDQYPKETIKNALALCKLLFKSERKIIDGKKYRAYLPEWSDAITEKKINTYALPGSIILDSKILKSLSASSSQNRYINIMRRSSSQSFITQHLNSIGTQLADASNSNGEEKDVFMSPEIMSKNMDKPRGSQKPILDPGKTKNKTRKTAQHQHVLPPAPIEELESKFKGRFRNALTQPSDDARLRDGIFPYDLFCNAPPVKQMQIVCLPTLESGYYGAPSLKEYPGIDLIKGCYFILPLPPHGFDLVLPTSKEQTGMLWVRSKYCPKGYKPAPPSPQPLWYPLPLPQAPQHPAQVFGPPPMRSFPLQTFQHQQMPAQFTFAGTLLTPSTLFSHSVAGPTQHLFLAPPSELIPKL